MIYLTQLLQKPVIDAKGETIGIVSDLGVATGEVFPRVTSVAFMGKDRKPFMLSWRKYVAEFGQYEIRLNNNKEDLRFSYLQPAELLLQRDLLDKQIVDTQGMKIVRVGDLKLAESKNELRLLGAEVGLRGILRRLSLEKATDTVGGIFGYHYPERLIAWNYMALLEKDMSSLKLSISHKRLHELHPADIADVIDQMKPEQRTKVFKYLDDTQAADTISETEPEVQASLVESLEVRRASDILEVMDPDDAADIIADLPYEKAESLLNLMGVKEAADIRKLLGYKEKTAGGIMTTDFVALDENLTVQQTIKTLREKSPDAETIYYVYVTDNKQKLKGVLSLRDLIVASPRKRIHELMLTDIIRVQADDDQEEVADKMTKYDLLAVPVVDEKDALLGIVTVDDALEVMEEEQAEDVSLLTGSPLTLLSFATAPVAGILKRVGWLVVWLGVGLIAGLILYLYSGLLSSTIALAFFIPLVIFLSNDISTHLVAAIARGEEEAIQGKIIAQRLLTDFAVGLIVGALAGLAIWLVSFGLKINPLLSLIVGVAITLTVILTSIIGTGLQILAVRISLEPKTYFGQILTIFIAIMSLAAYLSVAFLFRIW